MVRSSSSRNGQVKTETLFELNPNGDEVTINDMNVFEKNIKSTGTEIKSYNFHLVDENTFQNFIENKIRLKTFSGSINTIKGKKLMFDDNKIRFFDTKVYQMLQKNGILY